MDVKPPNDDVPPRDVFELVFASLREPGRAFAFPCDARGRVDIDRLGERARHNYFYARAAVGREFTQPKVTCGALA